MIGRQAGHTGVSPWNVGSTLVVLDAIDQEDRVAPVQPTVLLDVVSTGLVLARAGYTAIAPGTIGSRMCANQPGSSSLQPTGDVRGERQHLGHVALGRREQVLDRCLRDRVA